MSSSESGEAPNKAMVEELEKGEGAVQVSSTDKHLTRKILWKLDTRFSPIHYFLICYVSQQSKRKKIRK